MATRCSWCNTDPDEAAKRHEGPHATWCPHYRRVPDKHPITVTFEVKKHLMHHGARVRYYIEFPGGQLEHTVEGHVAEGSGYDDLAAAVLKRELARIAGQYLDRIKHSKEDA
jgi:hypothetical protein